MTDQQTAEVDAPKKVLDGEGLFDLMVEQSQKIFLDPTNPNSELPVGMFYAIDENDELNLIHTPWSNEEEKSVTLFLLRMFFQAKKMKMYGLAQETWSVERTRETKDDRPPSQCDDRKEHIFYAVVQLDKKPICRRQEILRPWDNSHPTLATIEDLPYDSVGGRMLELLGS